MKIHLSDLPEDEVYILLKNKYRKKFFKRFLSRFKTKERAAKALNLREGYSITRYQKGIRSCPLSIIKKVAHVNGEKLRIIEQNIMWIKRGKNKKVGKSKCIYYPKFPIVLNKNLARIFGNIIGDGCAFIKDDTGCPRLSYTNYDPVLINKFKTVVNECFGKIELSVYRHSVSLPAIVGMIILRFGCKSSSLTATIPEIIMNSEEKIKREFLQALFEDDGYVHFNLDNPNKPERIIGICSGSGKLIEQTKKLLLGLGIESYKGLMNGYPYLCISDRENIIKFREKIGFTQKYYKKVLLDELIKSYKKFQTKPGKVKGMILQLLTEFGTLKTNEITLKLKMKRSTVMYHLQRLKASGKIRSLPPKPIQGEKGLLKRNIPSLWFLVNNMRE